MQPRIPTFDRARRLAVCASAVILLLATPAGAESPAAKIAKLNKQGLDAFDNLNFDQAKSAFEQALAEADGAGLTQDPVAARTHLNLGMLWIAGFQRRDQAVEHFKAALKIQPDITAPAGLFNPEVQAAFDETKAARKTEPEAPKTPPRAVKQAKAPEDRAEAEASTEVQAEVEAGGEEAPVSSGSRYFLTLGLGSGFGVAKGHLDANKDLTQGSPPVADNSWAGGLAPSRLGHIVLGIGYFISPDLLLSLEGRLQIVTGTTAVTGTPSCATACNPPSIGLAGLLKASWYFKPAPLRPFVSGGLGVGSIRQVVNLNVKPSAADPTTHCGNGGNQTCVDTVTGGPLLMAAGAGVAYEMGSVVFLGSLTANVGVPKFMFNLDALLGMGVRL